CAALRAALDAVAADPSGGWAVTCGRWLIVATSPESVFRGEDGLIPHTIMIRASSAQERSACARPDPRRDPHPVKRLLASATATALALGGLLVATATPASAHSGEPIADCQSLTVDLWAYAKGNGLTVVVDGQTLEPRSFDGRFRRTYPLDPTQDHTWSVEVDAADHDRYDRSWNGSTTACEAPEEKTPVQVGVYVYPKLDADRPAAWENSGPQRIVTSGELPLPERPWDKTWLVTPLDLEAVREVARTIEPDVTTADLCTA